MQSPATGPKIIFRPAVAGVDQYGRATLRPDVRVADSRGYFVNQPEAVPTEAESLPEVEPNVEVPEEWSAPFVEGPFEAYPQQCGPEPRLGPVQDMWLTLKARLNGPCNCDRGLGAERVMHAISFVETTQPLNNFRVRFDAAYDLQAPDRSEYFWGKIGRQRSDAGRSP